MMETQIENFSFSVHVVKKKNKNNCEINKSYKRTGKACKTTVFLCLICKFVRFLKPSL